MIDFGFARDDVIFGIYYYFESVNICHKLTIVKFLWGESYFLKMFILKGKN